MAMWSIYGHLVYIFYHHLVYILPFWYIFAVLVYCVHKNLATLAKRKESFKEISVWFHFVSIINIRTYSAQLYEILRQFGWMTTRFGCDVTKTSFILFIKKYYQYCHLFNRFCVRSFSLFSMPQTLHKTIDISSTEIMLG
jgi:hypothetical protein